MFKRLLNYLVVRAKPETGDRPVIDFKEILSDRKKSPASSTRPVREPAIDPKVIARDRLADAGSLNGIEYELACAELLRAYGWQIDITPASGDQGVDLLAEMDGVRVVIQCKNYNKGKVGNKAVQEVFSGKRYFDADFAVVVTGAEYTPKAYDLSLVTSVLLLHHSELHLLEKTILGVSQRSIDHFDGVSSDLSSDDLPPKEYGMALIGKLSTDEPNNDSSPNRNDPCRCGSGKKYKHCHGSFNLG